jgi:N-acetylglucosaminyldiphosphoundecaprenol N-acetyl-beta-D-mannosaminyltransferase
LEHPLALLKQKTNKNSKKEFDKEIITFLNPYSYLLYRKNLSLFTDFDRIYIDGIILVKMLKLFGIHTDRKSFDMTSLAPEIFNRCQNRGKSIYFMGSDKSSIENFIKEIRDGYPNLNILGWRDGFYNDLDEREVEIQKILEINPDFLVVGMGTPLQEIFLSDLKSLGWKGIGFTCGGFIHQTANGLNYYPKWINKFHLRWLFRIYDEPKLLRRYLVQYPKFFMIYIYDLFTFEDINKL